MDQKYLTHENEVFENMMKNLDLMIERTVSNMIMRNADESTLTLKIVVTLDKKTVPNENGGIRQVTQPSFKHDLSSVMQVKDKMSGTFKGNVELIFDENGKPIVKDIDDGQMKMWDEDGKVSLEEDTEKDSNFQALPAGKLGIPENATIEAEFIEAEFEEIVDEPDENIEGDVGDDEPNTPYEYLMQYRNQAMRCQNNNGEYLVRANSDGNIILSSGLDEGSPFYIKADKLSKHVGHNLTCVTSPEESDDPAAVEIWCDDCGAYLFGILNPAHDNPNGVPDKDEEYGYESPEEE